MKTARSRNLYKLVLISYTGRVRENLKEQRINYQKMHYDQSFPLLPFQEESLEMHEFLTGLVTTV